MTSPSNKGEHEGVQQRTPEWFAAREGRVTASVAGAILGMSPYMKPEDVLRSMVRATKGAPSEFTGNIATEYGTSYEQDAIDQYMEQTGEVVEATGFHTYGDWLGGSPDGLIDTNGLIEVKCPYGKRHCLDNTEFKTLDEQPHYYAQVQVCLYVTGRTWADFVQWCPLGGLDITRVYFDSKWAETNIPKLAEFYQLYLSEVDNEDHLIDGQPESPLVEEYVRISGVIKELNDKKKELIAQVIAESGGKPMKFGNHKLIKTERSGTVNYKKMVQNLLPDAETAPFKGKATTVWSIR